MGQSIFWGLIQGFTEFLPISSSGHLVLVPALLGQEPPDLATSALLHVGTLVAVLVYFRSDIAEIFKRTPEGYRTLKFLVIGTIPAAIGGLLLGDQLEQLNDTPRAVAVALFFTGVVLLSTRLLERGSRTDGGTIKDAVVMGLGQAVALIPGVSRSGTTIAAGLTQQLERKEAARYSFILGIPAIAGAGFLQFLDLRSSGDGIPTELWAGVVVAAISGYAAIALLLNLIARTGLAPFGYYCMAAGVVAFVIV